jgi:hypothetical protein
MDIIQLKIMLGNDDQNTMWSAPPPQSNVGMYYQELTNLGVPREVSDGEWGDTDPLCVNAGDSGQV